MESATDAADATERLKREYLQLRRDIHENDKCIEAARRENASQLRTLNKLLQRRSTLALQICQFAQHFTDADHHDSLAEMESLRQLCKVNREHIRGLTAAIANQDDQSASNGQPANAAPDCAELCGPASGDEKGAPQSVRSTSAADPQLRSKGEFLEMLARHAAKSEDDDGKLRRAARSKHAEGDLAAPRHQKHATESSKKTKAFGAVPPKGRLDASPTVDDGRPFSPLVYGLVVVAALSSLPFLCPDAVWHRMLDKCLRAPPSPPVRPPASPVTVLRRARKFCGL